MTAARIRPQVSKVSKHETIDEMLKALLKEYQSVKKNCDGDLSNDNNVFIHVEVKAKIQDLLKSHQEAIEKLQAFYKAWHNEQDIRKVEQLTLRMRNAIEILNENIQASVDYAWLATQGEHSVPALILNHVHSSGNHLASGIKADKVKKTSLLDDMDLYIEGNKLMAAMLDRGPQLETPEEMKQFKVKVQTHIQAIEDEQKGKAETVRRVRLLQNLLLGLALAAVVLTFVFLISSVLCPAMLGATASTALASAFLIKAASISAATIAPFWALSLVPEFAAKLLEQSNKTAFEGNRYYPLHRQSIFAAKKMEDWAVAGKSASGATMTSRRG